MLTYQDIYLLAFDCLVIAGTAASSVLCPPYPPFIIRNSLFDIRHSSMSLPPKQSRILARTSKTAQFEEKSIDLPIQYMLKYTSPICTIVSRTNRT